jgi:hypothetical protein
MHCFHAFKDVFLLRQASEKVKTKANTLGTELLKKRIVAMETQAVSWMPSKGATPHEYLAGLYPPQA